VHLVGFYLLLFPFILFRWCKWGGKWRGSNDNLIICKRDVAWVTVMFFRRWVSGGFSCKTFHILSMEVQHFFFFFSEQYRKHVNFALINLSRHRIVCVALKLNFLAFKTILGLPESVILYLWCYSMVVWIDTSMTENKWRSILLVVYDVCFLIISKSLLVMHKMSLFSHTFDGQQFSF
jgi:hypothetical protein